MPSRIFAEGLLEGQVIAVTGGGSGPGRATAIELAACGASVTVAGRDAEALEETAGLCEGDRCRAVACDVREEDEIATLVDGVLERHGRIDTLVNSAGVELIPSPAEAPPEGPRSGVALGLEGTWLATHAVATRAMIPAGGGTIVTVTHSPDHRLSRGTHSPARAGVETMTRTLSIEWARFGIRLTAIACRDQPEEQAWLVAYLASPAGGYHSGSVITAK